jgi:hypothetical protein
MKNILNKIRIAFLITLISVTTAFADDDPGFGYEGDPGAAPISDYVPLMLVIAVGLGYFLIKRLQTKQA